MILHHAEAQRKNQEVRKEMSACISLRGFALLREIFLFPVLMIVVNSAFAQRNVLPEIHYSITAILNDKDHSVDGMLKLNYTNPSSDTLTCIWFQLWPNAFKNDRTAYSEAMLDSGRNDFYFSDRTQKGYINRLVFKLENEILQQEDHPRYIDIVKVNLPRPLLPGRSIEISTPFHVQLPYNFSGFGHIGHSYELRNWYPAIAFIDKNGWQPKPFTGQPSMTFADYDVKITLPLQYAVITNGTLSDSTAMDTLKTLTFHGAGLNDFFLSAQKNAVKKPMESGAFNKEIDTLSKKIFSKKILPAIGYNVYDGLQIGIAAHNPTADKFNWYAVPLFATSGKTITGYAGIAYEIAAGNRFEKIKFGLDAARFSDLKGVDSSNRKITGVFYKMTPYVRVYFPNANRHNTDWLEFKTYIIGERGFDYVKYSVDSFYYPVKGSVDTRYLNQLTFRHTSSRSLYPYNAQLQIQQAKSFYRINAETNYFFNYPKGGGLQARIFAAKFGYIGNGNESATYRYQPKLTAVRGDEDYTYSNAFIGRNEFSGFSSQQMMMRDGGLKIRTDMFQDLQGRSDNWVASMNINTTLPASIFPRGFPLKLFLDAGTYAGAWKKNTSLPRFLFVSGLQLSLFKNAVNIYVPLFYSREFRDNLKTVPEENSFFKKISFSFDFSRAVEKFVHKS